MDKAKLLADLYKEAEANISDLPLANKSTDIIPGEGSPQSEIFLIGEAPGYYETVERRPFVGRSGKLLRKLLTENALDPAGLYIGNIVKARPPENRDPNPAEIKAYKYYLDKEIEILNPKLVVTLGRFSMAKFLNDVRISQVHGRLHKVKWQEKNIFVLPMYHPAAALRSTKVKESFVADMRKIPKIVAWINDQLANQAFEEDIKGILL